MNNQHFELLRGEGTDLCQQIVNESNAQFGVEGVKLLFGGNLILADSDTDAGGGFGPFPRMQTLLARIQCALNPVLRQAAFSP